MDDKHGMAVVECPKCDSYYFEWLNYDTYTDTIIPNKDVTINGDLFPVGKAQVNGKRVNHGYVKFRKHGPRDCYQCKERLQCTQTQ